MSNIIRRTLFSTSFLYIVHLLQEESFSKIEIINTLHQIQTGILVNDIFIQYKPLLYQNQNQQADLNFYLYISNKFSEFKDLRPRKHVARIGSYEYKNYYIFLNRIVVLKKCVNCPFEFHRQI